MQRLKMKEKNIFIDSAFSSNKTTQIEFDLPLFEFIKKHKSSSWLFSKQGRTSSFFTSNSSLYFTQEELKKVRRGERLLNFGKKLDSLLPKEIQNQLKELPEEKLNLSNEVRERYIILKDYWSHLFDDSVRGFGLSKAWSISIVCSLIFGMFLMTMLYRYLGESAKAGTREAELALKNQKTASEKGEVAGASDTKEDDEITQKLLEEYAKLLEEGKSKDALGDKIAEMTKGYPIEKMAYNISKKDKVVAAFLVGIAMKESTWGKHVPVLDGQDCYNYWGYKGKRARMGTGGHTCFDSPQDAVDTVSKRLEFLVSNEKISTPEKMVTVWKCGYDCSWDSRQAVQKWVNDVDKYFEKFNEKEAG
jgi:hypothetical protein